MTHWIIRAKSRMKEVGITSLQLSEKLGVTRAAVGHYLTGRREPTLSQFNKLASLLKVSPAWLYNGTQDSTSLSTNENSNSYQPIPLLSWEQIAKIGIKKISSKEKKEFLPSFYVNQSDLFAATVKGDSMIAPTGYSKSFQEGDVLIINKKMQAHNGSYVIAILSSSNEAIFKQYVIDGGVSYLKSLNPQYPLIKLDKNAQICGVVTNCITNL